MKYLKLIAIVLIMAFLTSCDEVTPNYIASAVVDNDGHLILTYSDGTTEDQGLVIPEVVDVEMYLVNFYNTDGYIISTQVIEQGEDAFAPSLVLPESMVFDGWEIDFTNVTENLNVHPLYHYNTFSISFHNPEVAVPDITGIEYGATLTLPEPEVTGKEFLGWYVSDSPYAPLFPMFSEITSDLDLYARYEDIEYTVTFQNGDGTIWATQEAHYGDMMEIPEEPMMEDYFFNGWYYDQDEMMPVDFEALTMEDVDVYASWIQFEYEFRDYPGTPDDERIEILGVIGEHNYVHIPTMIDGYEVRIIRSEAFRYEPYLEVHLPDTIQELHGYAFADMPNLESIILPDSLTYVHGRVFENSTNLRDVTISENLSNIGYYMFANTAIESIVLPEGIEYIESSAFEGTPLSNVNFPTSLVWIGNYAFKDTLITEVVLPEGFMYLYSFVFQDCVNLTSVTLPESLEHIDNNPFDGASSLTSVTLHESNPHLEMVDDVIYNEAQNNLYVYLPYKTETTYQIPESVTYLRNNSITGNPYLETIILPDTLQGYSASYNFTNMESLSSIEVWDASGTAVIASENGVLYSADFTYLYKYPMGKTDTAFGVNSSTTRIYDYAFKNNIHITSVILNNGLERIYYRAFENCTNLSAINFPTTLINLSDGVFYNVDGITSITLPTSIQGIGYEIFAEMDNLTTLVLNEGLTYIPGRILKNSNNVTTLHIPSTVSNVYSDALVGAKGLETVTIEASNPNLNVYNNSVYSEDYTRLYAVPEGFNQEVYYMHSATTTMYAHFGANPYIKIIRVRYNVINFNSNVRDLPNLQGIEFQNSSQITYIGYWPFDPYTDEGFKLYVRSNLYDDYMADYNWSQFEDFVVPY